MILITRHKLNHNTIVLIQDENRDKTTQNNSFHSDLNLIQNCENEINELIWDSHFDWNLISLIDKWNNNPITEWKNASMHKMKLFRTSMRDASLSLQDLYLSSNNPCRPGTIGRNWNHFHVSKITHHKITLCNGIMSFSLSFWLVSGWSMSFLISFSTHSIVTTSPLQKARE